MKVGLVLEGGAMRGMYTAGVLDVMMDVGIAIDGIVGNSAGALFGVNYFSNQKGRVIRYSKRFCKDIRYISKTSLLFTGNIINKKFAFYTVTKKLDIFDNDAFVKSGKDYYAVVTNVETGKAEYVKIVNPLEQMEYLRATSAVPIVSRIVKVDGKKYLDGGVSDSIPVDKCMSLGYDKVIVILTRPLDYRKERLSPSKVKAVKSKYKKYHNLVDAMVNRHEVYNKTIEKIIDLEKEGKVFVIRPSEKINVKLIERDENKLEEVYDLGVSDAKEIINDLKEYLCNKSN